MSGETRLGEGVTQLFGGFSVAVDITEQHPLTSEDWAAATVLRQLNLAAEALAEHHTFRTVSFAM